MILATPFGMAKEVVVKSGEDVAAAMKREGVTKVVIEKGLYFLDETLVLGAEQEGLEVIGKEGAVLSGGVAIRGWRHDGDGVWRAKVPVKGLIVRDLFSMKDGRKQRSRIPNKGHLRGYALSKVDHELSRSTTAELVAPWREDRPYLYAGIRIKKEDLPLFVKMAKEPKGAMVETFGSWSASWHPLWKWDSKTGDVLMYTPSRYPISHWNYSVNTGGGTPYCIENTLMGMDLPGEWMFDVDKGEIAILLEKGRVPAEDEFVAARLETILRIEGAEGVKFRGVEFAHSAYGVGVYDQHKDWWAAFRKYYGDEVPKGKLPEGSTVPQSAPLLGEAVQLFDASGAVFEKCVFRNVGSYGIGIEGKCHGVKISRCGFYDMGGGGISIDPKKVRLKTDELPGKTLISDCEILRGGVIHPAAVGIRVAKSSDNIIEHNRIADFGYSGISIGWNWNPSPTPVKRNVVRANDIYDVMKDLSDGSCIYTLAQNEGMIVEENWLHDVPRSDTAIGAGSSGLFFDQYSRGITIRRNVVRRIETWKEEDKRKAHAVHHFRNVPEDHTFVDNDVDDKDSEIRLKEVVKKAGVRPE